VGKGQRIVEHFLHTLESRNLDELTKLVTDDIVYANPPTAPLEGKQAMIDFLSFNYKRMDRSSCVLHFVTESDDGDIVMTERTEYMHFGDRQAGATFMGIFEIRDGRIAAWRDYWDHASFAQQMAAIGQSAGPGIGKAEV
jgi:limonene-1,2-epoxide hydrolase